MIPVIPTLPLGRPGSWSRSELEIEMAYIMKLKYAQDTEAGEPPRLTLHWVILH